MLHCYTDGSLLEEKVGAGVFIIHNNQTILEESLYLGDKSTVFQAETIAINHAASSLLGQETTNQNIIIHCDSQAAILAIDGTKIKSKTTLSTIGVLNRLGSTNKVILRWIPAHSGYDGNEKADVLAKRGTTNNNSLVINPPIPKSVWKAEFKFLAKAESKVKWIAASNSFFKIAWRDKFHKIIPRLDRADLSLTTQILTGHAGINYHLHKYKPNSIPKSCPHCLAEEETISHFLGECPKWAQQRGAYFNTFYCSVSELLDNFNLSTILSFVRSTKRLEYKNEAPDHKAAG